VSHTNGHLQDVASAVMQVLLHYSLTAWKGVAADRVACRAVLTERNRSGDSQKGDTSSARGSFGRCGDGEDLGLALVCGQTTMKLKRWKRDGGDP